MTAQPADIAVLTNDGVVVSTDPVQGKQIKDQNVGAEPEGDATEIEMFWTDPAVAQVLLNERWATRRRPGTLHLGVEIMDAPGLGSAIALTPQVPIMRAIDQTSGLDVNARLRSYGQDTETSSYSLELME
jgi:hypothetical protein